MLILLFILFFKLGDVIAGVMANPFYVKLGFSNIEIANASKLYGVIATLFGVFIGGWLVKKIGIIKSLFLAGFLQIISNLLFVILSKIGPDYIFLIVTVSGENISGGLGSAAFVAYLSILCNKQYTATQYALLSSIMGIARTFLSSPSGYLVNFLGWSNFFLLSVLFGIPGILILIWMQRSFPISRQIKKIS
jgi:PAT family beta-lactamase induction signal transducer AmpG